LAEVNDLHERYMMEISWSWVWSRFAVKDKRTSISSCAAGRQSRRYLQASFASFRVLLVVLVAELYKQS
jgi:hypothetical protein